MVTLLDVMRADSPNAKHRVEAARLVPFQSEYDG